MAATTVARLYQGGIPLPTRGTIPSAANQFFPKGTMVSLDASANGVAPTDGDGLTVAGVVSSTYDNRTGSEFGGLAGSIDLDVDYGEHSFPYTGTAPKMFEFLYAVDNQTVSVDSDSGQRGFAGISLGVRNGEARCWLGPIAALVAAVLTNAAAVADHEDRIQVLEQ